MRRSKLSAGRWPRSTGRPGRGAWRRALAPGAAASLWGAGAAWAQQFKSAPKAEESGGGGGGPDTILGLIHVNTAFFIAIGVIAVLWFLFGGGRKAKVGRKGP